MDWFFGENTTLLQNLYLGFFTIIGIALFLSVCLITLRSVLRKKWVYFAPQSLFSLVFHGLSFSCVDCLGENNKSLLHTYVVICGMQVLLLRIVLLSAIFSFIHLLYY